MSASYDHEFSCYTLFDIPKCEHVVATVMVPIVTNLMLVVLRTTLVCVAIVHVIDIAGDCSHVHVFADIQRPKPWAKLSVLVEPSKVARYGV